MSLVRQVRGVFTVARRRGVGYFGYMLRGIALPAAAYRFAWGPSAAPLAQAIFAGAVQFASEAPDRSQLVRDGLLVEDASTPAADPPVDAIEALMDRAHSTGIAGVSGSFHHLVYAPDGTLRFGDLSRARRYQRGTLSFAAARDADRRAFNRVFNAAILTEADARRLLAELKARVPANYREYAPIDFGHGLVVGQVASTDSGSGRWEFFNKHVVAPIVAGRRVLDLGSNNGSLPLMMARSGAREVIGIEYTPALADLARLNVRILAWRDIRPYNIRIVTGDMRLFLREDLGRFDVITAFCSLYYLPEEDMKQVIRKAAMEGAVLVLQANEAIEGNLPGKAADLHAMMRSNGYSSVNVHVRDGYARPLLIGHPEPSARAVGV